MPKRVCIFCGANTGNVPTIIQAAEQLADLLAAAGCDLIYGGGETGLMGRIADRFLKGGRQVIGVRPRKLIADESAHSGIQELIVVEDMHERKAKMVELSDLFIALPGGVGTLDEIIETYTLHKIGFTTKPSGILNTNQYYAGLEQLLDRMVTDGFLRAEDRQLLIFADDPAQLLDRMTITVSGGRI